MLKRLKLLNHQVMTTHHQKRSQLPKSHRLQRQHLQQTFKVLNKLKLLQRRNHLQMMIALNQKRHPRKLPKSSLLQHKSRPKLKLRSQQRKNHPLMMMIVKVRRSQHQKLLPKLLQSNKRKILQTMMTVRVKKNLLQKQPLKSNKRRNHQMKRMMKKMKSLKPNQLLLNNNNQVEINLKKFSLEIYPSKQQKMV